jgi:hypothetical protein
MGSAQGAAARTRQGEGLSLPRSRARLTRRSCISAAARWLRSLSCEYVAQATFAGYCASVDLLAGRRATLVQTLEQTVPDCSHAPTIGALRCFRGIDTLTAGSPHARRLLVEAPQH